MDIRLARDHKAQYLSNSSCATNTSLDAVWLDTLLLIGASSFLGQSASSMSGNIALFRELNGAVPNTNHIAGYSTSGYTIVHGLVAEA